MCLRPLTLSCSSSGPTLTYWWAKPTGGRGRTKCFLVGYQAEQVSRESDMNQERAEPASCEQQLGGGTVPAVGSWLSHSSNLPLNGLYGVWHCKQEIWSTEHFLGKNPNQSTTETRNLPLSFEWNNANLQSQCLSCSHTSRELDLLYDEAKKSRVPIIFHFPNSFNEQRCESPGLYPASPGFHSKPHGMTGCDRWWWPLTIHSGAGRLEGALCQCASSRNRNARPEEMAALGF